MTQELKLKYPIQVGPETVTTLQLRRLKAKDMRVMDRSSGMDAMVQLAVAATGRTSGEIDELDAEDFSALQEVIGGFLAPGRKTGEASSTP